MEIKHLSFAYDEKKILNDVNIKFKRGAITTLMGANGCGKSTLLNICAGNLKSRAGRILLNGKRVEDYKRREFAREIGIVYQQNQILGDISVGRLVSYGRTPYLRPLQKYSEEDYQKIQFALEMTNLQELTERQVRTLSGGQRQRVFLAMALAQNSNILLLDEPTTYLDIKYQLEILALVKRINREMGVTIIMVLHDIMQAINYSDEVVGLFNGRIAFQGKPKEVLTDDVISNLYDTQLVIENFNDKTIVLPKDVV